MTNTTNQNYSNHRRFVPLYHYVLVFLVLALFISSLVYLFRSYGESERLFPASMVFLISIILIIITTLIRGFATKVQDRTIRAEENLRHYVLTGKLIPASLKLSQIIALRFAPDEEYINLAQKSSEQNLSSDAIKKEIKQWKGDHHRV